MPFSRQGIWTWSSGHHQRPPPPLPLIRDWVLASLLQPSLHPSHLVVFEKPSLQCSCLENSRDWGAWWAAVYGVAKSRTRLKQLSSTPVYGVAKSGTRLKQLSSTPVYGVAKSGTRLKQLSSTPVYGVAKSQTRLKQLSSSSTPV